MLNGSNFKITFNESEINLNSKKNKKILAIIKFFFCLSCVYIRILTTINGHK